MSETWFVKNENGVHGPVTGAALKQLARDGRLPRNAAVRKGEAGAWVAASQVKGLFDQVPQAETGSVATQPSTVRGEGAAAARRRPPFGLMLGAAIGAVLLIGIMVFWLAGRQRPQAAPASAVNDTELARLREENAELKSRLAQLEAAFRQARQSPTSTGAGSEAVMPPAAGTPQFDTPEAVVRAYLGAATWQERLAFVAEPDVVRPAMQNMYEYMTRAGPIDPGFKPEVYSKGKFLPSREQPNGSILVPVDMTGLDERPLWEYLVVSTPEGYKVDWRASMEYAKVREREIEIEHWRVENARVEVQVVRVEQRTTGSSRMAIRVTNRSEAFISFWNVAASAFDGSEQFLASGFTNGRNLRPGESVFKEDIFFSNVKATDISSWQLRLDNITLENESGERLSDADKYFELVEIK